jgi:radical SAM protein with 4Fe4S-binding SPASM domain
MSCSDCILFHSSSAEFFRDLAAKPAGPNDLTISGSLELTRRCNLRCAHCYVHYPGAPSGELSTADMRRVLDKLADAGVLSLLLTGGEILARRDFAELYVHASNLGFLLTLFTNATMVDEATADLLVDRRPRRIEITVYGHTPESCERVTGSGAAFGRFREGVDLLLQRNLPVEFKMMVLRSNAHEFDAIRDWAAQLGRPFRHDPIVNARLDGDLAPTRERLSPADTARLLGDSAESRDLFAANRAAAQSQPPARTLLRCGAGTKTFHVDPEGFLHPCMMWRSRPYPLLSGSIAEWKQLITGLWEQPLPAESLCGACSHRFSCGSCSAASQVETGRAGMHVDYFCRVCGEREKLLNVPTSELKSP